MGCPQSRVARFRGTTLYKTLPRKKEAFTGRQATMAKLGASAKVGFE
jgi:hypothetical protein